ncbi:MAG: hypothetical protein ACWGNV_03320 [Bacteroidales bacterium]
MLIFLASCSGNVMQTTVFKDGFQDLRAGLNPVTVEDDPAIYFSPERGRLGSWQVATYFRNQGFDDAWEIRREGDVNYLAQSFINLNVQNEPLSLTVHPMVVAGDSLWRDCTIEAEFTPLAKFDKCGIIFKYRNPSNYFYFGIEGNIVTLKRVMPSVTPLRPIEMTLDSRPLVWTPGERFTATITLRRNKVFTILNDSISMHAEDLPNQSGKIGLIADLPARFHRVEVKLLKGEQRKLARRKRQQQRRMELELGDHPAMVRWKHFDTPGFGTNQNVRMGDLTGDGNKELLFVKPASDGTMIAGMTSMNLNGEVLWKYGTTDTELSATGGPELPVQIRDTDGDGSREVVFVSGGSVHVLSGKAGELIRRIPLPGEVTVRTMAFGDLLGTGEDNCMVLSDRTGWLLVFDDQMELMWKRETSSGSQPFLFDLDGDGISEVLMGYTVYDHEGVLQFDVGKYIGDRCNGVTVDTLNDNGNKIPALIYAAGDWGLLYFDYNGNLLKQQVMGHVDYISVGNFNAEVQGLEVVTSDSWGSEGQVHLLNPAGEVTASFLLECGTIRCQPVNWKGDGEEFIMTVADSFQGGLINAQGRLAVAFPDDGHPESCYLVQDLTGDTRDELIVWDPDQLWIYTQEDNPRMGNTYAPHRIPPYNHSMHQMGRSAPGW